MPGGRLGRADRHHIAAGLADGLGYAEIARRLGRPTSTVSREVARNGGPAGYRADPAHVATSRRTRRPRPAPPPPAADEHGRQVESARRFGDRFAALMVRAGLPRMAARVLACLITTDAGALTSAELVERLLVSPASVSKAVGYLAELGLLRRERDAHRRERYVVDDDVWLRTWSVDAERHASWADAARDGASIFGAGTPAGDRLAAMGQFFATLSEQMTGGLTQELVEDVWTVLAALVHARTPRTADQLAVALGWPADRVDTALNDSERHPDLAGPVALRRAGDAYTVTARPDRLTAAQREAVTSHAATSHAAAGGDRVEQV